MSKATLTTRGVRISKAMLIASVALIILPVRPLHAGRFETIAGWEGDTRAQGYGFVTLGGLIPASPRLVVPMRTAVSFLYYTYDSTGTSIRVRSPGASLLAGLRLVGPRGSATLLGGGEVRWEQRETADVAVSKRDDTAAGVVVQVDADLTLATRWRGLVLGNYAGAAQYLYGRGAVRYQATNLDWQGPTSLFVGVEGVRQGNDESDSFQGGGFVECSLVPQHLSLALRSGYKESWSPGELHRRGGYLGVSAYRAF